MKLRRSTGGAFRARGEVTRGAPRNIHPHSNKNVLKCTLFEPTGVYFFIPPTYCLYSNSQRACGRRRSEVCQGTGKGSE